VYCSSCHDRDAKGASGPNLTTLAKWNDGKFPTVMVRETIRGEMRVDAHWSERHACLGRRIPLRWQRKSAGD
jgi:hypothetical protein